MTEGTRGSNAPLSSAFGAITHFFGLEDLGGGLFGFRRIPVTQVRPYGMFKVHRNSVNQTGLTAATFNKIQFTTRDWDHSSLYDISTNFRYTPLQAGIYEFGLWAAAASAVNDSPQTAIYKNGAQTVLGTYQNGGAGTNSWSHCSTQLSLNGSTDYIEAFVYVPTGITTLNGSPINTSFFGRRISG